MANNKNLDPESKMALEVIKSQDERDESIRLDSKKALRKQIEPYTDGLPYNRDRVIAIVKDKLILLKDEVVKIGKYLIWLQKEESVQPAGLTLDRILGQYLPNFARSTALNCMRLAKLSIEHPYFYEAIKHQTKTIALLEALTEEEIKELENGGIVADIKLDEVDRMSRRELKDHVRAYKKKDERGKEQVEELEEKLKKAKEEIEQLKNGKNDFLDFPKEDQEALNLLSSIMQEFTQITLTIRQKIDPKTASETVLKRLYMLYIFFNKVATDERVELSKEFDKAGPTEWEIDESEIPPNHIFIPNLPIPAKLSESYLKYIEEKRKKAKKDENI